MKKSFPIKTDLIQTFVFCARSDTNFIEYTLPQIINLSHKAKSPVFIIVDNKKPTGVLGNSINQDKLKHLCNKLNKLKSFLNLHICLSSYKPDSVKALNIKQFNYPHQETHCFRGYPIYWSFKQLIDYNSKYILHFDCDMIFYEESTFSWIQEGIRIMEENEDILCVLPRGGPPTKDGSLNQGSTPYKTDEKRGLYLFKNFTSRHFLIHRERFLSLLPLKPLWLSWREPIKSRLHGNGKMLCWETMVEEALTKSDMWRADLMTEKAWSLHPGDRSEEFYQLLPQIIDSVNRNEFPEEQKGHFDLRLNDWKHFLN